ncbi:MAG: 2-hydroxyhepta-2,4-diene-1,7-dioate isomerase [Pelagibacterium sp. SCN 64-44]|nr:MAG: 2-hydroxyhepta-2,4-diene-1,7-dioate isomerase [Pelagibacterium sp. SCN 64-44]
MATGKMRPRYVSFKGPDGHSFGIVNAAGVIDLRRRNPQWPNLKAVIADGALSGLADDLEGVAPDYPLEAITYDIPLAAPEKIICVGVNFPDRNAEYKDGQAAPAYPSLFVRFPGSFVGHGQPLIRPRESEQLDYEGEIALVIGKAGRRISEAEALDHVAALTLCNEGSVRDWMRHAKFNVTQGKNFDRSGALGPWLIPFESEAQIADIALETRVNGEMRQSDRTSRMTFSFRRIIAYVSTFTTLKPGDIIVTGTPTGAGARLEPPVWLKPGDVVEVEAEGIGILRNSIADEDS